MKILADENITDVVTSFAPYGEVRTIAGRAITREALHDIDALLVRSITKVDAALLENTPCRFVGTATSGIDHLDMDGLRAAGIAVGWAKGCNSNAVVDYVGSCLAQLSCRGSGLLATKDWRECSVGIIGCGEIGGALARRMQQLGVSFRVYDPFLPANHPFAERLTTLHEVLQQDIITLHVPLTMDGPWPTFHMLDARNLPAIPAHSILINAARGAVIDNRALLQWATERPSQCIVLDTWEHEPAVDLALLRRVQIGTPHIAGYSHEGKLQGTRMLLEQFCQHFGLPQPTPQPDAEQRRTLIPVGGNSKEQLNHLLLDAYDVGADHAVMQTLLHHPAPAQAFDNQRKHYPMRHEFSHFRVAAAALYPDVVPALQALGFRLDDQQQ